MINIQEWNCWIIWNYWGGFEELCYFEGALLFKAQDLWTKKTELHLMLSYKNYPFIKIIALDKIKVSNHGLFFHTPNTYIGGHSKFKHSIKNLSISAQMLSEGEFGSVLRCHFHCKHLLHVLTTGWVGSHISSQLT